MSVAVERVQIASLTKDPKNARQHSGRNIEAIKASLREFGQQKPIVVDVEGKILAGNGTLDAAIALGWTEIDVARSHLKGTKAKAYAVADNRTGELAEWNESFLAEALAEIEGDESLDSICTGFDPAEIVRAINSGMAGDVKEDEVPEPPAVALTKPGDLYLLGDHRLLCGDSTKAEDVVRVMAEERADLTFTSPPYNQDLQGQSTPTGMHSSNAWFKRLSKSYPDAMPEEEYQQWQVDVLNKCYELTHPGGSLFYNHKHRYRDRRPIIPLDWIRKTSWELRQEIIWDRRGGVAANAGMFIPGDERIYWLEKDGDHVWNGIGSNRTTVWAISPQANNGDHVCPYPVEIPSISISSVTDKGNIVFDPFLGSGTTIIASEQLGRRCFGLEIEPRYCDVIVKRWENLTGKKAIHG